MEDHPTELRRFVSRVVRVGLLGLLIGGAGSVLVNLLLTRPLSRYLDGFWPSVSRSSAVGLIFALSFYLLCGYPWRWFGPMLHVYPESVRRPLVALVGAVGASLAYTIALLCGRYFLGVDFLNGAPLLGVLGIEAICGAIIAMIIGAFKKLRKDVQEVEARMHEKEMREKSLAEAAAKAQSAALQSQINPHFFFNTLNTLSALIPINADAAQEIVGRLADMFRYTLACSRADCVTLDQELAFTENYLKLEQARFSTRLRVSLPKGEFGDIHLPGLSLQPLVENAIRYGVAKRVEGGDVEVAVRRNGTACSVDVFSPLEEPVEASRFFRDGHALANVRDRLKLYGGDAAGVEVVQEPNQVRVSLVLPK